MRRPDGQLTENSVNERFGLYAPFEGCAYTARTPIESQSAKCGASFRCANSAQPLERAKLVTRLCSQTFRGSRGFFVAMTPLGSNAFIAIIG